jgi:two-component system, cell cycle sensor histidine kinase and response regulator CckA
MTLAEKADTPTASNINPVPPDARVILLVDDEPAQRQLFAFALRRDGYHVIEARNGAEALELAARTERIDLLISDVVMPVMQGPEMAERLCQRLPGLRVLFVSGFIQEETIGPNARVMHKPFVRRDLLKSVMELIGPGKV